MKKTICVFLAIVMCMALAIPVLADDPDPTKGGTQYTSTVQTPSIEITASTSNVIILNPYNIAVAQNSVGSGDSIQSGGGWDDIEDDDNTTAGVIAPTTVLKNTSNIPVKVSISATGSIPQGSTATFSTTKPADTEKTHKVFMYLVVDNKGVLTDGSEDIPVAADGITGTVEDYADAKVWSASNPTGTQAVIKAGEVKMTDVVTLAVPDAGKSGYLTIDIGGVCSSAPQTPWEATDKVEVKLAYTFVASANSVSS